MTTTTMTLPMTKTTPIEIAFPTTLEHEDHGLELVHEMGGQPRNYLHQVSMIAGSEAEGYAIDLGYIYLSGYMKGSNRMKVYTKQFSLMVANW